MPRNKTNDTELRSYVFPLESREREGAEGVKTITGRAIVFGQYTDIGGWFQEVIEPGALDKTDLTDVPLLVNHNDRMLPVARSRRNTPNSTLRLQPDTAGMGMEADLDVANNGTARELGSAVERGDIDGMSFRFTISKERWDNLDTDYPTRHIDEISKVYEISAVTWPAYEGTQLYARSKEALENARKELESARNDRDGSPEGEDTAELEKLKIKYLLEEN